MNHGNHCQKKNEDGQGLQRGLSNRHLQLMALGGAIGTGMFMGSSNTINQAGPSSMLIYICQRSASRSCRCGSTITATWPRI